MSASRHRPTSQRPLTDPLWWTALGLWILNDHLLKGAGLLDGAITGKLSDLCGLWVLPAGLAAAASRILGSKHPRWPYLAVGLYFAGLQLWPAWASVSEAVLASFGVPSKITPDPSDLFALFVLWPAFLRYGASPPLPRPRLGDRWALAGYPIMLLATVATSRIDQPEGVQRTGRLFVLNNTDSAQQITLKQVRADVEANCFSIQSEPHKHLHESLFEPIETATLGPKGILAIDARAETNLQSDVPSEQAGCQAMIIEGDKIKPQLLFWKNDQFPLQRFTDLPDPPNQDGIIAIEKAPQPGPFPFIYRHTGNTGIGHEVMSASLEPATPECAPPSPALNIEWGEPFPRGSHRLESIEAGADGCIALELASQEDAEQTTRRYLCIPPERFPFEQGSILQFRSLEGETAVFGKNIEGWDIKGWKNNSTDKDPDLEFFMVLGQGVPDLEGLTFGTRPPPCPYAPIQADCQTLSHPLDLMAKLNSTGQEIILAPKGASAEQKLADDSGEWTIELLQSEYRSVFDGSCSGDRVRTGTELQFLATWRRKVL